eukprot:Awhi_evm1s15613
MPFTLLYLLGDYDVIMTAIKNAHLRLHDMGVVRISTTLRFGSRTDKEQTSQDKIDAVQNELQHVDK